MESREDTLPPGLAKIDRFLPQVLGSSANGAGHLSQSTVWESVGQALTQVRSQEKKESLG